MKAARRLMAATVFAALLAPACLCLPPTRSNQGAAVGGAVGGTTGMILDRHNPWRGGIIGGLIGAMVGATLADVSDRAAMEAARAQRPAEYRTEDGRGRYRAEPLGPDPRSRCRRVREQVWQDGQLVRDQERVICVEETNAPAYR